ncbi:MAG: hypothetical protein ACRD91_03360, partial [Nitrosopumilaceae archaeon]
KIPTEKNDSITRINECVISESMVALNGNSEIRNDDRDAISATKITINADITRKSLPVLNSL